MSVVVASKATEVGLIGRNVTVVVVRDGVVRREGHPFVTEEIKAGVVVSGVLANATSTDFECAFIAVEAEGFEREVFCFIDDDLGPVVGAISMAINVDNDPWDILRGHEIEEKLIAVRGIIEEGLNYAKVMVIELKSFDILRKRENEMASTIEFGIISWWGLDGWGFSGRMVARC